MKMFLRILVILVIGGLFFLGGFLLGSKDPSTSVDTDSLSAEVPKLDVALPGEKTKEKENVAEDKGNKGGAKEPSAPNEKENVEDSSSDKKAEGDPMKLAKLPEVPKLHGLTGKDSEEKPSEDPTPEKEKDAQVKEDAKETKTTKVPDASKKENKVESPENKSKEPETPEAEKPMASPNRLTYSIQVGTFLERELAEERARELKSREYQTFVVSAWDQNRQLWHTVRVGNYTDLTEARLAAREIQKKERIQAHVYGIGTIRFDDLPIEEEASATPPAGEMADPAQKNTKESTNVP